MPARFMNPIAILQHECNQGPGYLLSHLCSQGLDCEVFQATRGQALPRWISDYSGLVVLGSNHSVNDEQPWIEAELGLLRQAVALDVPVLGHCFGAQLLARALGARVHRHAWPHIGWSRLWATPAGRERLGGQAQVTMFNWHHDSFEIPSGAQRILFGSHCLNKGFAHGRHLGLQSHLEVTEDSVRAWCAESREEIRQALAQGHGRTVQSEEELLRELPARTAELHRLARNVYGHWLRGLRQPLASHLHGGW